MGAIEGAGEPGTGTLVFLTWIQCVSAGLGATPAESR